MLFGKIECRIAEKFVILLARNNFCVKLFRKLFCIAYVIVVTVCKNYIFKLSAVFLNFRKLKNLEGDYRVIPGHGPTTTLDHERKYNPLMRIL